MEDPQPQTPARSFNAPGRGEPSSNVQCRVFCKRLPVKTNRQRSTPDTRSRNKPAPLPTPGRCALPSIASSCCKGCRRERGRKVCRRPRR